MSLFKAVVLFTLSLLCLAYMCYTRQYYLYCAHSRMKNDYMVNNEIKELYTVLCNDVFRDYSDHSVLKYSLDIVYSLIINLDLSEQEYNGLKFFIKNTNYYNMKFELKALKIVHFAFYMLVLYIVIILLPRMLIDLLLYLFDKLLLIVFGVLIMEAVLNMYLDVNVDILRILQKLGNYFPLRLFGGALWNVINEMGKMVVHQDMGNI